MLKLSTRTRSKFCPINFKCRNNYASDLTGSIDRLGRPKTLAVSRTRGTPSSSTNLKEALCEKIPLHHDLVRKFRLRHGTSVVSHITVEDLYQGLKGVSTTVRETSEIDPKVGVKYRGLSIPEVVALLPRRGNSPCPEAVFWLLLTGDIPTHEQTASLTADWTSRRQRRRAWWSEKGGGIVGAVLQTLPKTVPPLKRLCIALSTLDTDKHIREATKNGAMSYTHWEYAYEDCMEVLAVLPAVVGLVSKTQDFDNFPAEEGDWVDILLDCLGNISSDDKGKKSSLGEFLRLYIAVNADEDCSSPGVHATQILGDATLDPCQALAAGVLGYTEEPKNGSMHQYMEFQTKLHNALGFRPSEAAIKNYLESLIEQDEPTGYRESETCDPRYIILRNYARENLPEASQVELSRIISKLFIPMLKQAKAKNYWPINNAIAAPVFQFYGLRDMEFNQVLLCMSRALGAIASMIWAKATNAPVESPRSNSTYTYVEALCKVQKRSRKYPASYVKRYSK